MITYKELAKYITTWPEDQQSATVTFYDEGSDECYAADVLFASDEDDDPTAGVLDEGHPYLTVGATEE